MKCISSPSIPQLLNKRFPLGVRFHLPNSIDIECELKHNFENSIQSNAEDTIITVCVDLQKFKSLSTYKYWGEIVKNKLQSVHCENIIAKVVSPLNLKNSRNITKNHNLLIQTYNYYLSRISYFLSYSQVIAY